jgi:hypothetical protein
MGRKPGQDRNVMAVTAISTVAVLVALVLGLRAGHMM